MKITKATLKRLNAHSKASKPSYIPQISVIAEILNRSAVILGEPGRYEINNGSDDLCRPLVYGEGKHEFISGRTANTYEKRIVAGMAQRFPKWISGTLTHGLNGVDIYRPNELVKAILDN